MSYVAEGWTGTLSMSSWRTSPNLTRDQPSGITGSPQSDVKLCPCSIELVVRLCECGERGRGVCLGPLGAREIGAHIERPPVLLDLVKVDESGAPPGLALGGSVGGDDVVHIGGR